MNICCALGADDVVGFEYDFWVRIGLLSRYMSGTVEMSPKMAFKSSP